MTTINLPEGFDLEKFTHPTVDLPTLTWYSDRVETVEDLTPEQEAALQAALDAYDPLEFARQEARNTLNDAIGSFRQLLITPAAEQGNVYQEKNKIADRWLADDPANRTRENYPAPFREWDAYQAQGVTEIVSDIAGGTLSVATVDDVVATWLFNANFLHTVAIPESESLRVETKIRIDNATSQAELDSALADLQTGLAAILG